MTQSCVPSRIRSQFSGVWFFIERKTLAKGKKKRKGLYEFLDGKKIFLINILFPSLPVVWKEKKKKKTEKKILFNSDQDFTKNCYAERKKIFCISGISCLIQNRRFDWSLTQKNESKILIGWNIPHPRHNPRGMLDICKVRFASD